MLTPAVYWNLSSGNGVEFNRNHAQLAVNVAYVYHFKTSNGTHHFKTYDIGAKNDEINKLKEKLVSEVKKNQSLIENNTKLNSQLAALNSKGDTLNMKWVVEFEQGKSELSSKAKEELKNVIDAKKIVSVVAKASPEGSKDTNKKLSDERAAVVTKYLTDNGVTVKKSEGVGAESKYSNRVVLITLSK